MRFRGRVSVKLLKTGRIGIDYLDDSHRQGNGAWELIVVPRFDVADAVDLDDPEAARAD